MRINWFSPVTPALTDIAHYTGRVLPALAKRAEVTIWTDQEEWDPSLRDYGEVQEYRLDELSFDEWYRLNKADITFYNIGNNPCFHGPLWQISQRHAGVVILHDTRLQHLFFHLYADFWKNPDRYRAAMARHYGQAGLEAADRKLRGDTTLEELSELLPLTSLALENALGAVVHVPSAFEQLVHEDLRPVAYAPLPYAASSTEAALCDSRWAKGPPYRLIVFGYLGPNRRLNAVLKALSGISGRDKFHLYVYGKLDNPEPLRRDIQEMGLARHVTIVGYVSERELDEAVASAHIGINLRYPTMGEASGSQLRMWNQGLPTLVTQTGWYATLPEEAVAFVHPEREIADIQRHLNDFLDDPQRFARKGEAGFRILRQDHAPAKYAEALINFACRVQQYRGRLNAVTLVERTGAILSEWAAGVDHVPMLNRMADEIRRFAA